MADWTAVKQKVEEVRKKYHLVSTPVNVFDVAEKEGIAISYFKPNGTSNEISGFLVKEEKRIYLNPDESAQRQNFTLAHELAHYFLEHDPTKYGVYWRNARYTIKPEAEKEADHFAAELLMPRKAILEVKGKYRLTDDDASTLATLFGVSLSAMKARLRHLGHEQGN